MQIFLWYMYKNVLRKNKKLCMAGRSYGSVIYLYTFVLVIDYLAAWKQSDSLLISDQKL